MNRVIGISIVAWAGAIAACSSSGTSTGPQLAVQGTVSQAVQVDNARAVAIGSDGTTVWAYLNAQRDFTLMLPVGQSYRIVIANARQGGGQVIVGHLVVSSGSSSWLGANQPGSIDLGTLKLQWEKSGGDDDDDDDGHHHHHHDGDGDCHHGHHGDDDDACDDGHDEKLSPTKEPGEECRDHDHDGHHHHHHDGGGDDDDDDNDDPPCQTADGGPASDAGSNADSGGGGGGSDAGGGGIGADCLTNADCKPPLMCVMGLCTQ